MDENSLPPSSSPYAPSQPAIPPPLTGLPGPPPRRRKTSGWRIAAIILGLLLLFSVLSQLGLFMSAFFGGMGSAGASGTIPFQEVTIEDNNSDNKIAVLAIEGLIFGGSMGRGQSGLVKSFEEQLKLAAADKRIKAVLLRINSPGGEVLASDEISQAIANFQKNTRKPVIASMGSVAASGGYYVAAPCRWIVAHELTITGSIGVIMHSYNYRGLMNKVGVRPVVFKSGRFKDMLSGERDLENLSPEDQTTVELEDAMIQKLIDQTFARFRSVVEQGRQTANQLNQKNAASQGNSLADNWKDYVDGRVWSGTEAFDNGFVDELGNWRTAVKRAHKLANIMDANLVQYQAPFDLSNLFRILGQTETATVKLDVGLDLPKLQPGLLYFVAPTYVH